MLQYITCTVLEYCTVQYWNFSLFPSKLALGTGGQFSVFHHFPYIHWVILDVGLQTPAGLVQAGYPSVNGPGARSQALIYLEPVGGGDHHPNTQLAKETSFCYT
jgi:hypothetical protein